MSSHIHKNIRPFIREKPLRSRHRRLDTPYTRKNLISTHSILKDKTRNHTSQKPNEIFDRDFIPAIIHLDVVAVQIEGPRLARVNGPSELVPRVAGDVICEHENDVRVGYAEAFHGSIPAVCQAAARGEGGGDTYIPKAFAIC
jgi:hypothetical protein